MTAVCPAAVGCIGKAGIRLSNKTESLVLELKWLAETATQKRLEGDYVWLKAVYNF